MIDHSIRVRARHRGGETRVTALVLHPMETGLRTDASGRAIAAHYITDLTVSVEDRVVLEAQLSIAVSKDPLLSFRFRGGRPGESIRVAWVDNRGQRRSAEATIT